MKNYKEAKSAIFNNQVKFNDGTIPGRPGM
jgi:hypothetical protein